MIKGSQRIGHPAGLHGALSLLFILAMTVHGPQATSAAAELTRQGNRLRITEQDRSLSISLNCPTFIFERQTIDREITPTEVRGKITSAHGIEADFAPIALEGPARLEVKLFARWSAEESVLRKWAAFRVTHATSATLLKEIILERIDTKGRTVDMTGGPPNSMPAFMDCFFAGVEFPMANTCLVGSELRVGHRPGWRLVAGQWRESRRAVFGAAPKGQEKRAFQHYLGLHRPAPQGLHINYNSWWTSPVPYTEQDILKLIDIFEQKLAKPYGTSFDSFCIDMGWSDPQSLWGIDAKRFPQGFSKLDQAIGRTGGHLGLWISPSGFYTPGGIDTEWAAAAGYESFTIPWVNNKPVRVLCLAGEKYARGFRQRLADITKQSHLSQIKFDGYWPTCPAADHGHAPGDLSAEAVAEGIIATFKAVRQVAPKIWFEPTCFGPGSPWWLFYTNSMVGTYGEDSPYGRVPAPVYRESYTTARDLIDMQGASLLPIPIRNQEVLGLVHQSPEPFMNDAVMVLMRGNMFISVYLNPKFMDGARWKDLADTFKWARRNAPGLEETVPILPAAWAGGAVPRFTNEFKAPREPYGFSHVSGTRGGLIGLRNPWIVARTVALTLDESIGVPPGTKGLTAVSLFPEPRLYGRKLGFGDTLNVPLAPYETLVLSLTPESDHAAGTLPLVATALGQGIQVQGKQESRRPIETAGGGKTQTQIDLQAELTVAAPEGQLLILKECDTPTSGPLEARLTVDGKPRTLRVTGSATGWSCSGAPQPEHWVFQSAPLSQGKHTLALTLTSDSQTTPSRVSVWGWATKPKSGGAVKYPNTLPQPETLSLGSVCLLEPAEMGVKGR